MIKAYKGIMPKIDPTAFIAETAVIIGDVEIGADSSIWYGTVVRGDVFFIKIGSGVNIQDGAVVHATKGRFPTIIEDEVTIGHGAVLHGCTVRRGALIGIGAVILDNAEVGEGAIIAAGAVVSPETKIPSHMLAVGIPAKGKKKLSVSEMEWVKSRATLYRDLAKDYKSE